MIKKKNKWPLLFNQFAHVSSVRQEYLILVVTFDTHSFDDGWHFGAINGTMPLDQGHTLPQVCV
jgi:hypothetical protein